MKEKDQRTKSKDPHTDIPAEANTTKHINFLDAELNDTDSAGRQDDETTERQRQWQEGLEEGRRANNQE